MTPWTRQMLEGMGWHEGEPIPGDIGVKLQAAIKETKNQPAVHPMGEAPAPGSRTKIGSQVNFEDLSPERQAELQQAMSEAQEVIANRVATPLEQAEAQVSPTLAPGVRNVVVAATAAQIEAGVDPEQPVGPEVVIKSSSPDFRKPPARPPAQPTAQPPRAGETTTYNKPPAPSVEDVVAAMPERMKPPPGAQVVSVEGISSFVTGQVPRPPKDTQLDPPPPPPSEPETEAAPEHDHDEGAGGLLPITRCPRCLWNMAHSFEAEPTEEDRRTFVAAILGGKRFRKQYGVMGNKFRVTFRSMTTAESDLVFRQLRLDQLRGIILGDADYFGRLTMYRLACMVDNIAQGDGTIIADVPPIMDIPYDEPEFGTPEQTRLLPLLEWFNAEICKTESMRHIVAQQHRDFQRIVEALETQTSDPSFWEEIG